MKNAWELWEGAIDPRLCDQIIAGSINLPPVDGTAGFGDGVRTDTNIRRAEIKWINPSYQNIGSILMDIARKSNRTNFGYDINHLNEVQLSKYDEGVQGTYDWHHDLWIENPDMYDRKLTVVVQMSDAGDYTGGVFEFMHLESPSLKKKGSVLVFPTFLMHRVTPVFEGTRYSLATWVEGPRFR